METTRAESQSHRPASRVAAAKSGFAVAALLLGSACAERPVSVIVSHDAASASSGVHRNLGAADSGTINGAGKVTRQVGKNVVSFTPAVHAKGCSLEQMSEGFFLGELESTGGAQFGPEQTPTTLPPGKYKLWLARSTGSWGVFATDAHGQVLASTSSVSLELDGDSPGGFLPSTTEIFVPEAAPHAMADEGPGTVHGCQCHDVTHCVNQSTGDGGMRRVCWTERVCSCWN